MLRILMKSTRIINGENEMYKLNNTSIRRCQMRSYD